MKRTLPYISISGTLQELIEIETHLAFYYDEPYEEWNNIWCKKKPSHIICNDIDIFSYCIYSTFEGTKATKENSFHASQLEEILTYIENYK